MFLIVQSISSSECSPCRLPFTMLVLQKAVRTVWSLPEVMRVPYAFMLIMLSWMTIWSFGVAGVVASNIGYNGRWWLLVVSWQVFSLSFFFFFWLFNPPPSAPFLFLHFTSNLSQNFPVGVLSELILDRSCALQHSPRRCIWHGVPRSVPWRPGLPFDAPQAAGKLYTVRCDDVFWEHLLWIAFHGRNPHITLGGLMLCHTPDRD